MLRFFIGLRLALEPNLRFSNHFSKGKVLYDSLVTLKV
jgi:hypothetical protein